MCVCVRYGIDSVHIIRYVVVEFENEVYSCYDRRSHGFDSGGLEVGSREAL